MNKVFLFGNVGKDPEVKKVGENQVAKFSLATQSLRKDTAGNKVTDWHNIVAWGKLAELSQKYIKKGSALIVEGEIQYRNYTDKDGVVKYITEISASSIHFAGKKESEPSQNNEGKYKKEGTVLDAASKTAEFYDDLKKADELKDLPF